MPNTLREEKSRELPKIIGSPHNEANISSIKQIIDGLTRPTTIGLERSEATPKTYPPLVEKFFKEQQISPEKEFFTKVAEYAQQKGHKIIWLEQPVGFRLEQAN